MAYVLKDLYAPAPQVTRGKPLVIKGDPKGKYFVYTFGKTVVVRELEDPSKGYTYNEHAQDCTVAAFAPSGNYMASGDASGNVRIWATDHVDHILKYEYRPLSGAIKDICWSPDSKRIVVCGEGKDVFARAFLWDSGSSVGEVVGHSKYLNSVDFKQERPYRVATASEDTDTGFFAGPPFKLDHLNTEHTNFVNSVRFSPDGRFYVSGGADGRALLYDGKEGKLVAEFGGGEPAHKGGIYALAWAPDSKRFISASGDKSVKMWDAENNTCLATFTFADVLENQQLGCLWQGDTIISVGLGGDITYLDEANPSTPKRVLKAHLKGISALAVVPGGERFYAASSDGRTSCYEVASGDCTLIGNGYGCNVTSLQVVDGTLQATAFDDTFSETPLDAADITADRLPLGSQPHDAASAAGGATVVACAGSVVVVQGGKVVCTVPADYEPLSVASNPAGSEVAVGGKNKSIHIYSLSGGKLEEKQVLEASGSVHCVGYSPCGKFLASGDSGRNVFVYDASAGYACKMDRWKFHRSKVVSLAWTSDSKHIATSSIDTNVIIWNMDNEMKRTTIQGAHPLYDVTKLAWLNDNTLLTAGRDATFRTWEITHA